MLWTPGNSWGFRATNFTARPANAMGTSITPGNDTKGSWTEIIADSVITEDCYLVYVNINVANAADVRDCIIDIGIDRTGGTSWEVLIPDLLGSSAGGFLTGGTGTGGRNYVFPLYVKNGSAIAARASINNATVGTLFVWVIMYGKPSRPELIKAGAGVTAFGIVSASSTGTAVTPGTTSEGSWVELEDATIRDYWWWQLGTGVNDSTLTSMNYACDLGVGDASAKKVVIEDQQILHTSGETVGGPLYLGHPYYEAPVGSHVYGRSQMSAATADTGFSMAGYGVWG